MKTAWRNVRNRTGIDGRLHDARHTLITQLSENGAGEQTIMDIAGHVSRSMLKRYSHMRMKAKREALEAIATGEAAQSERRPEDPARTNLQKTKES